MLPYEAYPDGVSEQGRQRIDAAITQLLPLLPTEPGSYRDCHGELWHLNEKGEWTDHENVTKPASWSLVIALFGPFTLANEPSH